MSFAPARWPASQPAVVPPLRVGDAVDAFMASALPGAPQSFVEGVGLGYLREPDPRAQGEEWGLGEVPLQVGGRGLRDPLARDDVVDLLGFTKPYPNSVLRAACAIAAHAPLIVFDESMTCVMVDEGDAPEDVLSSWPW